MTDLEALYQAILESPDDNTLRLIYADALEEEGNPRRAAFIRTQIQLADVPEYDPAWVRIRFHDRDKMPGAWFRELPELPEGLDWASEPFRRGFVANIETDDARAYLAHADDLFTRFPIEALVLKNSLGVSSETETVTMAGRLVMSIVACDDGCTCPEVSKSIP